MRRLRAGTPNPVRPRWCSAAGCTYRQRLEQVFTEFGWPSAARFEFGTLDGMIGCVAADMGVTLLPRAVVERGDLKGEHPHPRAQARRNRGSIPLFIQRRGAHHYSALQGFAACLKEQRPGHCGLRLQRRSATTAQTASTSPNGQAPCKNP